MKKKYYEVKSMHSSHKNQIGRFVSSFMIDGEEYHTLRFDGQGFRSYPVRNLKEYSVPVFDTTSLIAMMRESVKMFRPKKEKVNKLKRFKDFVSFTERIQNEPCFAIHDGKVYNRTVWRMNDIFEMLDYLAGEIEKLKNK